MSNQQDLAIWGWLCVFWKDSKTRAYCLCRKTRTGQLVDGTFTNRPGERQLRLSLAALLTVPFPVPGRAKSFVFPRWPNFLFSRPHKLSRGTRH
jgi:hypothetical protein